MKKNINKKTVFVVGSKPDPIFPDVEPDCVYAANGAIANVQSYVDKCEVVGVVSNYVFSLKDDGCKTTATMLNGTWVDKLYTFGLSNERKKLSAPNTFGLKYGTWIKLGQYKLLYIKLKFYRITSLIIKILRSNSVYYICEKIFVVFLKGKLEEVAISTGMISLALALFENKNANVYLIGIGKEKSGHFYDKNKRYHSRHIEHDLYFLNNVLNNISNSNIIATDRSLSLWLTKDI